MAATGFDAVLFDCDGVLVDSEPITNGVLRDMLEDAGWCLTNEECFGLFVGHAVKDKADLIEHHTGRPLTEAWLAGFRDRRNTELEARLTAIPHVHGAVETVRAATGGRIACASGADLGKVHLQLRKVGLYDMFGGMVFSGHDTPRSKPFPDVYLAAAAALAVLPTRCAVVEDTVTGVTAGVAAGATVFGYAPLGAAQGQVLRDAGAVAVYGSMQDLPALLGFTA